MQGQDQSVNLSGMLGQIAETTGSMGDAYKPVMQEATKPRGKMDDPNHLQRLAQWASNNGDTAAASMYMSQSRELAAVQRREQERAQAKADNATMNTATARYAEALRGGDQATIDAARIELQEASNLTGVDAQARFAAVDREHDRITNEAYAKDERVREAKERQDMEKLSTAMNNASLEEIPDIVKNAPPAVAMAAQRMANTRTAYLRNEEEVAAQKKLDQTALSADVHLDPALPEESRASLQAEIDQLQEEIDGSYINGTFVGGSRGKLEARRRNIADRAFAAANAIHSANQVEHNRREGEYRRLSTSIETKSGTTAERNAIKKDLKEKHDGWGLSDSSKWGEQAITDEWRRQQRESARGLYPEFATWPNAPEIGTVEDGYEYIGGDPALESSYKAVE